MEFDIIQFDMSVELLKKIQESRKLALEKGSLIELKKIDVTKESITNPQQSKIKYSWYQTPTKVGIQIPYIVKEKSDLVVKFTKTTVTIDFPMNEKEHYHLDLELYGEIITARSKKIHRLDSIEIMMEKKQQDMAWFSLTKSGEKLKDAEEKAEINYPSSAKTKRNWDKIGKEIDNEIMKHGEEYGMDPGMMFFQEIFKNADPDKRKAMIKSFQTSSGTVLSTDWGDVSKKDYEGKDRPSPPKGQEWKKPQI